MTIMISSFAMIIPMVYGFAVSSLFTIFIYKEKFTKQQLLGVILGIAAIIILKL